ncbi:hypothetical protein LB467_13885 [Salegentibacter sp. JZCK2]|uniref:hypothetical protein n=1 Tax=Salegentibacter tibetensis TaxID=2873600 RepID=UPI001CCF093C|nr:hypothetical protein [Salegentibacter tibetensis]MBZ9730781.1 hypothetical protein [Salegentibacter tibetensis]
MENLNVLEILAFIIAIIGLIVSVIFNFKSKQVDKDIERLIANSRINKDLEKFIKIRNSNLNNKRRIITHKEYYTLMNKLRGLTDKLDENEKKIFIRTLDSKSEKNKINYLKKLLYESQKDSSFKDFEVQK